MIKLCLGNVFKTLSLCKSGHKPSDDELTKRLFSCVGTEYIEPFIGHVKNCTKNPPELIQSYFRSENIREMIGDIRKSCCSVFAALPDNGQLDAVSALYGIIYNDHSLPDIVLGINPRYRINRIRQSNLFEPVDFLANILISVCRNSNILKDSGSNELDLNFIKSSREKYGIQLADNIEELEKISSKFTNGRDGQQMTQNNFGGVVINNPVKMKYIEHADIIHFD